MTNRFARNAGSLMLSTVASSGLGFLFWIVAARWFSPASVGHASAMVSSMTLLAGVAQLNLVSLYARFLPGAGRRTSRYLVVGTVSAVAMAVALSGGYLGLGLGRGIVAPAVLGITVFTVAVVATALHFIVDGALTPLGRAEAVPVKNVLAALARLGALIAFVLSGYAVTGTAMFAAWTAPTLLVVVATGVWVLARLAPRHAARPRPVINGQPRGVVSFASAEYVNGIVANVVAFVPPLLVTWVLGASAGAYFYVPWIIGVAVSTLLWNLVTTFVVSATEDGQHVATHLRRAVRTGGAVVGAAMAVSLVAAEPLLGLLGEPYAQHGSLSLRLVALSLPFTGVLLLYAAFCVMDTTMWRLAAAQTAAAVLLVAGSWWGLTHTTSPLESAAPAAAHLVTQAVVGVALIPAVVRRYRRLIASPAVTVPGPAMAAPATAAAVPGPASRPRVAVSLPPLAIADRRGE